MNGNQDHSKPCNVTVNTVPLTNLILTTVPVINLKLTILEFARNYHISRVLTSGRNDRCLR